ncbi:MAG: tyrosine-type recombinase/integrase [Candidatus Eremiobacteraeota bacterium]|nr:tyrosine-type recombinase/integrase [Candidatus Eremiobacteraeota bacterium]
MKNVALWAGVIAAWAANIWPGLCGSMREYARKIGLEKIVTPHVLRHCCATHLLRRGAGIRQLQALLGHNNLDTTQIYTRVEVSDLVKVIEKFHPRERTEHEL